MEDGTQGKAEATWDKFLADWPPERVKKMTLDEYTNRQKNSFIYAVEFGTSADLGSIQGGSAYKFGVYARQDTSKPPAASAGRAQNETHGWQTKYGSSPAEAFKTVRARVVAIIDAAKSGNLGAIDGIEFADATKWKIAFLYQDRAQPTVLPIYQEEMLRRLYKELHPDAFDDDEVSQMHAALLEAHRADGTVLTVGRQLWTRANAESNSAAASTDVADSPAGGDEAKQRTARAPKNLLLYGPPGTGKTHRTAELAVSICDGGTAASDRSALMTRYRDLREEGRIAFVTFHQSYGYEEFVEGIRPVMAAKFGISDVLPPANNGGVEYEVRAGVFKRLCERASSKSTKVARAGFRIDPKRMSCWKMSLGNTQAEEGDSWFDEAMEENVLLLGWGEGLDYTGCDTREEVQQLLHEKKPEAARFNVEAVHCFKNRMKEGDAVLISDGNRFCRAIGRVAAPYEKPRANDARQRRKVEWLVTFNPSIPVSDVLDVSFNMKSIYGLYNEDLKVAALNALLAGADDGPRNHVLIIDEINRGNVSKILGELITLLEPDKRLGEQNALTVTLPHSGDEFGVPSNVYVIGTMNTADRSIAFLDTALRRRFEFQELMPDMGVIKEHVGIVGAVDVARLVFTMNERIELLYDREHTLGHAFFVAVKSLEDLRHVFLAKVVPLLQEYFYGDWSKICQTLGCAFDPETGRLRSANPAPILSSSVLDEKRLVGVSDSFEPRVRCTVNSAFISATGEKLAAFFHGVIGVPTATDAEDAG